jgi:PAS domain S-box-containing protein
MPSPQPYLKAAFLPSCVSARTRIHGAGELADLVRSKDWSQTLLGPLETWAETLVATVNLLLLSPFPFALYWGEKLTLLYNDAYRPFLGEKHPAALGHLGPQVWQEAWPVIGPPIFAALHHQQSTAANDVFIPVLIGGDLQDRWWTYSFYPVYQDGRVAGVANSGADDTPRVRARQEQQKAEFSRDRLTAQLEQILEGTTDGIALIDRDWRLTYFNKAGRQIAQTDAPVIGRNLWEAFPAMLYEGSPHVLNHTRAMDEGLTGEFITTYPSGGIESLQVISRPIPDGIVVIFRDITQQRRDADALMQTEKLAAVGKLASSIAHEINNPLESVTNLLYLMKCSSTLQETQSYAEIAERELRRVSIITNQTLRFHKQATSPEPIFCADLIGESLSIFHGRLVNAGIQIEKRKRALRPVTCFTGEIRQVLSNLIGNAIDAMPSGGRLIVRSREATHPQSGAPGLVLTVADTGTGMSPATLKKIYAPFFTTKGIGGTGLGLWVSSEIVGRHHGSLRVRSSRREPDHGTVFTLFLPFAAAPRG